MFYILTAFFLGFLVFCLTSAYYRYMIRTHYVYFDSETLTNISEQLDPRKKLPSDNRESDYLKMRLKEIADLIKRRTKSLRKNI